MKRIVVLALLVILCGCAQKVDQSQLYKPPEEKRDAKDMRSDYIAMFDGVIE